MNAHRAFDRKSSDRARGRTEQKAVLSLSQRSREQCGDGPPDRCPDPERQERHHDQSCSRTQPMMRGTLPKRLGRWPPIIYGISVVQNNLAIHQLPRHLVCANLVNAITMPTRQALQCQKSVLGRIRSGGGFGGLGTPETLPARAHTQGELNFQTTNQSPRDKSKITIKDVSVTNRRDVVRFSSGRARGV